MIFAPNPKKDLAARDFLNKFPPEGEAWVIEETRWEMAAIFGNPGQSYGSYTVKFPHLAVGGGGNVYESPEHMHEHALDTLYRELKRQKPGVTWTVRFHVSDTGDQNAALEQQKVRKAELDQHMYRWHEQNDRPAPKYT